MNDAHPYPAEFERGLRSGEVRLPHCNACGKFHWYPLLRCPHCLSATIDWIRPSGVATVFSCSTVEHAFSPDWAKALPYTVALIEFNDAPGVRLVGQLVENEPASAGIGSVVEPMIIRDGETPRLVFRATPSGRAE